MSSYSVVERSIAELRSALDSGQVTSVGLVASYLDRIKTYDHSGITLNSIVELNGSALEEAAESDRRRAAGETPRPLEGIPFTAKDSYMVKGMTVANGSPAFRDLVANFDAFAVAALREAGAVILGLTNMPPMANGGMQRGLYGRAESPYNPEFLTSAWTSGSSNGSGTATAASFAAFGLGEETWSSGRAPASCNSLCAYTPSRGLISMRGNWPLVPTMDVVVPHTRTMADLCEVLDVLVTEDPRSEGDFWRMQPWVKLPPPRDVVAHGFTAIRDEYLSRMSESTPLAGVRLAVPRMFIGKDPDQGTGIGIGAIIGSRIEPRPSVLALFESARADLEGAGAEVIETDFPVITNYEGDRAGAPNLMTRGLVSREFLDLEIWDLSIWSWNLFLDLNGQPGLNSLAQVEGSDIFPRHPEDLLDDFTSDIDVDLREYVTRARERGIRDPFVGEMADTIRQGLMALEKTRDIDFDQWVRHNDFDAVVFPTLVDVGPADAHANPESAKLAKRNGVGVATGNLAIRHLGIPTVTVPMGLAEDISMPFGITFAGASYTDMQLVGMSSVFEALRKRRVPPPRTPASID